jgi:hypothetical protein
MNELLGITDDSQMTTWINNHSGKIVSKRIKRDEDNVSLEEFFV